MILSLGNVGLFGFINLVRVVEGLVRLSRAEFLFLADVTSRRLLPQVGDLAGFASQSPSMSLVRAQEEACMLRRLRCRSSAATPNASSPATLATPSMAEGVSGVNASGEPPDAGNASVFGELRSSVGRRLRSRHG